MSELLLILLGLAVLWLAYGCWRLAAAVHGWRRDWAAGRLLELFGPVATRVADDPRVLLDWQPVVAAARGRFPDAFGELDRVYGGRFPFDASRIQAAHARWSADWLAWERAHDAEYKLKAARAEEELEASGGRANPVGRATLDAIEREQLERYQQRYEEYVRVSKALKALQDEG